MMAENDVNTDEDQYTLNDSAKMSSPKALDFAPNVDALSGDHQPLMVIKQNSNSRLPPKGSVPAPQKSKTSKASTTHRGALS